MAKILVSHFKTEGLFTEIFNSGNVKSFSTGGGTKDANVAVCLSHNHDRRPANHQFETEVEQTWNVRRKQCPNLYNGSKFRLHGVRCSEGSVVTLLLGKTCYKDYVCTNMNSQSWQFLGDFGKREHGNEHACFSDALGVGAIVESSDNKLVFIRRSHHVYEAPGQIDTPGGHAEPDVSKNKY